MPNFQRVFLMSLALILWACQPEGHPKGWQPLDLLQYGAPVSVLAPPSANVTKGKLSSALFQDLSINGGDDYQVQLFHATAMTNDIAKLKNDQLENVKTNRYFNRVVKEDASGFIYQMVIDSIAAYGFRLVKIQGDMELTFQNGMNKIFDLKEVEMMYEAVK